MLKNILRLLLSKFYSKKESELVGHQAMPSENKIVLTPAVLEASYWMDMLNATAVSDGYVVAQASSTAQNGFLGIRQNPNQTIVTGTGDVNQSPTLTLPISKGSSFTVLGDKVKNLSVWFVPIIGGVQTFKDALLQGGGLCLNSLLASLRRSFLQVRGSGWLSKILLQCRVLWKFRRLRTDLIIHTLHHLTALSSLNTLVIEAQLITMNWTSSTARLESSLFMREMRGDLFLCLSQKVRMFLFAVALPILSCGFIGYRTQGQTSFVGGAL